MSSSEWLRKAGVSDCFWNLTRLTFLGYDNAEQRIGGWDSFVEVVIIVDWKEVPMDVSISQQHVDTGDVMNSLEEAVELQETTGAVPL